MAFESLSDKLNFAIQKAARQGQADRSRTSRTPCARCALALLEADVNYKVVKDFVADSHRAARWDRTCHGEPDPCAAGHQDRQRRADGTDGRQRGRAHLTSSLTSRPRSIMMCGLQGAGKTTHTAQAGQTLYQGGPPPAARRLRRLPPRRQSNSSKVVGEKAGASRCSPFRVKSPVAIAKKAVAHAKDHGNDIVHPRHRRPPARRRRH